MIGVQETVVKLVLLLLLASTLFGADRVESCFKVHDLLRSDDDHYWSLWSNTCKAEIEVVYVAVEFFDKTEKIGNGLWEIRWPKGFHRLNKWSTSMTIPVGTVIKIRKITTKLEEALHP
jgi:hypothetical protein